MYFVVHKNNNMSPPEAFMLLVSNVHKLCGFRNVLSQRDYQILFILPVVPLCIIDYDKVSIDFTVDICRENIQDAAKAQLGPSLDSCTIGKLY